MKMDVVVVGLAPGTVPLPDIGMDVPHGIVVRISPEKASNSRDLWIAVNQRLVIQLQGGLPELLPPGPKPMDVDVAAIQAENARLVQEVARLRAQLLQQSDGSKLDEVLLLLKQQGSVQQVVQTATSASVPGPARAAGVVEMDAPTFIPSTIRSTSGSEARVEVQESSEGGSLEQSRSRLREMRQKNANK